MLIYLESTPSNSLVTKSTILSFVKCSSTTSETILNKSLILAFFSFVIDSSLTSTKLYLSFSSLLIPNLL